MAISDEAQARIDEVARDLAAAYDLSLEEARSVMAGALRLATFEQKARPTAEEIEAKDAEVERIRRAGGLGV